MTLHHLLTPVLPRFPQVTPDMEVEVLRELPVETLYLALKEADSDTALWFFQNAAPEQVQGVMDVDIWKGAEFLPERATYFFKMITLVSIPKVGALMRSLDPEVIVRTLLEHIEVQDFDPQEPPNVPESRLLITLDNKYALILKSEDPDLREAIYLWVNKVSAADIELLRHHLESCKFEQISDLEEFGYQVKKGRLEDMGFVDRQEAIALYAYGRAADVKKEILDNPLDSKIGVETRSVRETDSADNLEDDDSRLLQNEEFLPEVLHGPLFQDGFLYESFKGLAPGKLREVILMEIIRTLNASLAADDILQGSLTEIREHSNRTRRYLDIGLTYLADGQTERGTRLLEKYPLAQVFRLGWLAVQDLVTAASGVSKAAGAMIFGSRDGEFLTALHGRHPELPPAVLRELGATHFLSIDTLLKAGARLAALAQIAPYFLQDMGTALRIPAEAMAPDESAYTRLLTGLYRQSCGQEFSCAPLSNEEWDTLTPHYKAEDLRRAAQVVVERCPAAARTHFELRLKEQIDDLEFYLQNARGKRPDTKILKVLRWKDS